MTNSGSGYDGGYHALKGFFFQFDATLLEIFAAEPTEVVEIEGQQDFSRGHVFTQVKYRAGNFSLSKVEPAVIQVLAEYRDDPTSEFRLYCHFQNRKAGDVLALTVENIAEMLTKPAYDDVGEFDDVTIGGFVDKFRVVFAPDFLAQFDEVAKLIRERYNSPNEDHALCLHAILHRHLNDLVLNNPPGERKVTPLELDQAVRERKDTLFYAGYIAHLGSEKYLKLIRGRFKSRNLNMAYRERLVIVECDGATHLQDIANLAISVGKKYYRHEQSPAPYLLLRGKFDESAVKIAIWNARMKFFDGTYFNGDRPRYDELAGKTPQGIAVKILTDRDIQAVADRVNWQEVYDFFRTSPLAFDHGSDVRSYQMYIEKTSDVASVLA